MEKKVQYSIWKADRWPMHSTVAVLDYSYRYICTVDVEAGSRLLLLVLTTSPDTHFLNCEHITNKIIPSGNW